jgi:hypothetical protein
MPVGFGAGLPVREDDDEGLELDDTEVLRNGDVLQLAVNGAYEGLRVGAALRLTGPTKKRRGGLVFVYGARDGGTGDLQYWLTKPRYMLRYFYMSLPIPEDYVSMEELERSYSSVEEEILTDDNGRQILPAMWPRDAQANLRHGPLPAWFPMDEQGFVTRKSHHSGGVHVIGPSVAARWPHTT